MDELKTVVFKLNNQICGAYTSQVSEIIRYRQVYKVPKQPRFVEGLINLRSKVVPVVNLNKRFDLGETETGKKTKIIITELGNSSIGFIVNDVTEIINFAQEDIEPPPAIVQNASTAYLEGVGKRDEKLISILDLSKILTDKELKRIEKLS